MPSKPHPLIRPGRLTSETADGMRVTEFRSCRITVGQLRALCEPHVGQQGDVAKLAIEKLRSVRLLDDAVAVVLTVDQVETLGGTVGFSVVRKPKRPHRIVRAAMENPVTTLSQELEHLAAVTRHRRADLLQDALVGLPAGTPVPLEEEFLKELEAKAPKRQKTSKK